MGGASGRRTAAFNVLPALIVPGWPVAVKRLNDASDPVAWDGPKRYAICAALGSVALP
jgi:hypothetical protein